ncbi:MAG: tRNA pseudouridine(38-40) synthase TruA [Gammaproteobacteria bacterium]|nr:tRNA pseudouridine(38-40) synthase TruA [Gammaproteobacteria bacterium]MCP4088895.1 tRNA pseudouridine(38-40) synthase TruA [Gammaproteobacteria bacterium]MCP4274911.1 tRNA pseudouridine(38-40) synthase TruA [Gammaproteobacteria bacterium]MCP4832022.1 tRNA pseudouridine(38-40) synthase TruA [Gammaproteobacteria bacterium]MCP4929457.1 tRNA pseudouridine(38-40) synthase TruA [Gammaproteobacteria bacterium]
MTAQSLQRFATGIEYDGAAYCGWQSQPHAPSIQQEINRALSVVAAKPLQCLGAGRTDSGVHASGQVAHFETSVSRSPRSWLLGANSNLPDDISILWVRPVTADFHARFSAVSRTYRYVILNRQVRSALQRERVWWIYHPLDHKRMHAAAQQLLGKHDFSAFRASACQANTPVRVMEHLNVTRTGDYLYVDCKANAFLHHMVRNIVGSLIRIGQGEASVKWLADVLHGRDRTKSGITAPAAGLTLTSVGYPHGLLGQSDAGDLPAA